MHKIRLTLACGDYEIIRALKDGRVEPDGIELQVLTGDRTRILKSVRRDECDLAEFNIVGYLADRETDSSITALPVFPHRRFRHGFLFCNPAGQIRTPADLRGQRVGIMGERPAAAVWVRGILSDCYGVDYSSVRWIDSRGIMGEVPEKVPAEWLAGDADPIEQLLLHGELAAVVAPSFPRSFLRGDERIGRLLPDFKHAEIEYYRTTGLFPIMHTVVIKRRVADEHPWAPAALAQAFEESKRLAYERIRNPRTLPLAFFQSTWEEQAALLGPDPWQYGLGDANRRNLGTVIRYAAEQRLIQQAPDIDDAFIPLDQSAFVGTPGF